MGRMLFSVSYSPKCYEHEHWYHTTPAAPYDDWVARGRPQETIFTYSNHCNDDILRYYFMPAERLAIMDYYVEFMGDVTVVARLSMDSRERTIEIDRMHCTRISYWGRDERRGGIGLYKTIRAEIRKRWGTTDAAPGARRSAPTWSTASRRRRPSRSTTGAGRLEWRPRSTPRRRSAHTTRFGISAR